MASDVIPGVADALPALGAGCVLTVGTFDGVHVGHRDLVGRLVARARSLALRAVLVTFEPHPLAVVKPDLAPALLTPGEERLEELAALGLDYVVVLPFTPTLARYSATDFVEQLLLRRFGARALLVGYDHGLGRGRTGDVALLQSLGVVHGFPVEVVDEVRVDDGAVSSTAIRRAIAAGDLALAERLLGRRLSLRGTVVHGDHLGRTIGYPTINVALADARKLLPPDGVYAVFVDGVRGRVGGMMSIGSRPTVGDSRRSIEVNLFDVGGDWYGESVRVSIAHRLRDIVRFDGLPALVAQLAKDESAARLALTQLEEWDTLRGFASQTPSFP